MPTEKSIAVVLLTNPAMQEHALRVAGLWRDALPQATIDLEPMPQSATVELLESFRTHAAGMGHTNLIVAPAHIIPVNRGGPAALIAEPGRSIVVATAPVLLGMDLTTYNQTPLPSDKIARAFCVGCGLVPQEHNLRVASMKVTQHPVDTMNPADFVKIIFTVPIGEFVHTSDVRHQAGLDGFINALPENL